MIRKSVFFLFVISISLILLQNIWAADIPTGQTPEEKANGGSKGISADVFGDKQGVFHPFLIGETIWSSNLFYTDKNETHGFTTKISPGIWIALPATREKLMSLATSGSAPGGVEYSHMQVDSSRRMQTYFLYSPSFISYSDQSKYNHTDHTLEGLFNYNFGFDLSLEIYDQYNIKSNINDDGLGKKFDEYDDNIFTIVTSYEPSQRFKIRFDFSNYFTKFDKSINKYRDRQDNSFSAYIFYKFKPKTSIFLEYEHADIDYDRRSGYDSKENRYYTGINWEVSAKSKGQVKLGYLGKKFHGNANKNQKDFSMEAQIQHALTSKSSISFNAYQKYHETSMTDADYIRTSGLSFAFLQRFTKKWSGAINTSYVKEIYQGSKRKDTIYGIGPGLKFNAKKWLVFEGGFHYNKRDSNYDIYDYVNKMIYLRIKIAF